MPEFHSDRHYAEKAWQRKEHGIGRTETNKGSWEQMVTETQTGNEQTTNWRK
jgi:hypothetical protein